MAQLGTSPARTMRGLSFPWRVMLAVDLINLSMRATNCSCNHSNWDSLSCTVVIEAVIPAGHETQATAKTPVIETSVAIKSSLATEIAVAPGKMRTRKPTAQSAAYFATTEMAATEMAATEMAATESATVTSAATKTAPVTSATATAPVRKRVDSQSAGESGNRSQDDHGLA